jgi:hypothetical protein
MTTFWKAALAAAATAGLAFAGWRFAQTEEDASEAPSPAPATNGDFAAEGRGAGDELTREQREALLDELETQLGA